MEMFPIFRNLAVFAVCGVMAVACGSQGAPTVVHGDGYGSLRFGMKLDEAEKALGHKLAPFNANDEETCRYYKAEGALANLAFMTADGVVVRLDVQPGSGIVTDAGAKIGDSEARVLELYKGRVEVQPHKYTGPEGHYLVVKGGDGKVQLVFETDGAKVVSYRAGVEPQVQYVEGCS
jgi:hypothetical protein